jgi:hypothetical protein
MERIIVFSILVTFLLTAPKGAQAFITLDTDRPTF